MSRISAKRRRKPVVHPVEAPWFLITVSYLVYLGIALVCFAVANLFWSDQILTSFDKLLGQGLVTEGLGKVWFIFLWGGVITLLAVLLGKRHVSPFSRSEQTARGLWVSFHAGVFEELVYRALAFLACMPYIVFLNFILFGAIKWLDVQFLLPLANWATFGALESQLLGVNWVFGAAIIFSVGLFRDEHKYLGPLGWVNSWFIGMVMFWLVFNYGLLTAIAAHVIYDAIIFTIVAVTSEQEELSLASQIRRMMQA